MKSTFKVVTIYGGKDFPKLMTNKAGTLVVLFRGKKEGTVVSCTDDRYTLGWYFDCWEMPEFFDFRGEVVLESE